MKRFNTLFSKPHTESRPWALWTWNLELTPSTIESQLEYLVEQGIGGIAVQPGRDMKPAFLSEDFNELFEMVLATAKNKGIGVRLSVDMSKPWTTGLGSHLWSSRGSRASRLTLEKVEEVSGRSKYAAEFDDATDTFVIAARVEESVVQSMTDIKVLGIGKESIAWTAPTGDWQVMTLRRVDDTDVFGEFVANMFSTECASAFTRDVLGAIRKRFSGYMTSTFAGIVFEMPVIMPRQNSIPWDDDLVVKYRSRYKKDLVKLLPVVFGAVDEPLAKNRSHLYNYLLQSMYDRFVASVETWIRKHHLSQWVLCAERGPVVADGALRNYFAIPETSLTATGLQCYDGIEESFVACRAMATMNDVAHRRETVAVIGRSLQRSANTLQSLKKEIDLAQATGATHLLLDGFYANLDHRSVGKAGFSPFWYSPESSGLKGLCDYATALTVSMARTQTAPKIAVLYPSTSVHADYRPGQDEAIRRANSLLRRTSRLLREQNTEFDVVSEDFVLGCSIRQNGEFGTADRVRKGNYQVLIIPYARLISKSLLVFVEKLTARKGTVVFLDQAPEGDLDDGSTRTFSARFEKMMDLRKGAIHVVPARDLPAALGELESEITVEANGAPTPDVHVAHRSGDNFDLYLIRNTSTTDDSFATIKVPSRKHVTLVQCGRGEIHEHISVEANDGTAKFDLAFMPMQSHLVVVSNTKAALTKANRDQKRRFKISTCSNRSYRMVLKNQWQFQPVSPNALPLASWNMRIGLSRESGGYSHFYETSFFARELPESCVLVLNGLQHTVKEAGGLERNVEITVNGNKLPFGIDPAEAGEHYSVLNDLQLVNLHGCVNRGPNRIIIRATGLLSHPASLLYPPLIAGDFSVRKESRGWTIDEPQQEVGHDTWTAHGFPYLSGTGEYRHVFEVPTKYDGLVLRFSSVSGSASVALNGEDAGTVGWQPMEVDVTNMCTQKRNELVVRVTNTVDNLLRLNGRPSGLLGEAYVDVY